MNDKSVRDWIKEGFHHSPWPGGSEWDRARGAWIYLMATRKLGVPDRYATQNHMTIPNIPGADKDLNLAYAEHYMYARYVVAKTGDYHGEDLMVWAYETNKVGAFAAGNQGHLMLSKYAPAPPSLDAIVWGQLGIEEGLKDYKKTHPQQDGKLGDAILLDKDL